ncbi:MAG: PDZ domain-containing protein, partial [Francisellaceae bacterium]|nr:PDZ domain-containing protein [Francisellaceae bacterium]
NAGNIGLGFAIPSNMAKSIMTQLASSGHVDRGPLGVSPQVLTPDLAKAFGASSTKGAVIIDLLHNSPAQTAGLTVGDVIIGVNNKEVKNPAHLRTMISIIPIGSTITVKIIRDKKEKELEVKLTSLKDNYTDGENIFPGLKGVYLDESTPADSPYVGIKIMEINPQSIASNTELQIGDVIIAANKSKTTSLKELTKIAQENKEILLLQVSRDNINFFVALPAKTN